MKNNQGVILLEAILAIVVFTIITLAVIPMLSFLLRRTERSKYEPQATVLLQEAQEVAYNIFTSDWNAYTTGTYHPARGATRWVLASDPETELQTRFTRTMTIKYACRDAAGNITNLTSPICGGTQDTNTRIVTTDIEWTEADQPKKISSSLTLVNLE